MSEKIKIDGKGCIFVGERLYVGRVKAVHNVEKVLSGVLASFPVQKGNQRVQ